LSRVFTTIGKCDSRGIALGGFVPLESQFEFDTILSCSLHAPFHTGLSYAKGYWIWALELWDTRAWAPVLWDTRAWAPVLWVPMASEFQGPMNPRALGLMMPEQCNFYAFRLGVYVLSLPLHSVRFTNCASFKSYTHQ